jgi:hypothetical protein
MTLPLVAAGLLPAGQLTPPLVAAGLLPAGQLTLPRLLVGVARAISADARCAHPVLRSLDGGCAFGILPALAANAVSIGTGNPSPDPD